MSFLCFTSSFVIAKWKHSSDEAPSSFTFYHGLLTSSFGCCVLSIRFYSFFLRSRFPSFWLFFSIFLHSSEINFDDIFLFLGTFSLLARSIFWPESWKGFYLFHSLKQILFCAHHIGFCGKNAVTYTNVSGSPFLSSHTYSCTILGSTGYIHISHGILYLLYIICTWCVSSVLVCYLSGTFGVLDRY